MPNLDPGLDHLDFRRLQLHQLLFSMCEVALVARLARPQIVVLAEDRLVSLLALSLFIYISSFKLASHRAQALEAHVPRAQKSNSHLQKSALQARFKPASSASALFEVLAQGCFPSATLN